MAVTKGKSTVNIKTSGGSMRIGRIVLISGIGIISVALLIKMIRKSRAVSSGRRAASDPNVQLATLFNTAINPSRSWVGGIFTGANKEEIFSLSKQIKDFDDVAKEYYNLYEESLTHEIQDALGEDYSQFLKIISGEKISTINASGLAKRLFEAYNDMSGIFVFKVDYESIAEFSRLTTEDKVTVVNTYKSLYNRSLQDDIMEIKENIS